MSALNKQKKKTFLEASRSLFWRAVELILTLFYHEMFKRNTRDPLNELCKEHEPAELSAILRDWSERKRDESKYIQVAGGFLFTSVTSCLQWNSIQTSHWSAGALFYSSLVFSLAAIVNGSQQILVLPSEKRKSSAYNLERDHAFALKVRDRMRKGGTKGANIKAFFALQAPILLLMLSVMTFLAGLGAVVFSPLARHLAWNGDAKTALTFGIASILAFAIFYSTSLVVHWLFPVEQIAEITDENC